MASCPKKSASQIRYQPCEFARLAGVTVRALHHYDRLGLLKPSDRTAAGYRLYGPEDFARLRQRLVQIFRAVVAAGGPPKTYTFIFERRIPGAAAR
jgi:hypothetical protein